MGFFSKIKEGLTKTRKAMAETLGNVFSGFSNLDDDFYDELEECLILADLGVETAGRAVESLRRRVKEEKIREPEEAKAALKDILVEMLDVGDTRLRLDTQPSVVLVIGVNGVGKTTTIGKLAKQLGDQGKRVLMCAGDTFRAAAADQLEIWAGRTGADIVRQHEGADPAAVVYDGIQAAKARHADVILCDTAGRLHNKANLMNELSKISRIIDRELPEAQGGSPGSGRHHRAERPAPGQAIQGNCRCDGHGPHQAGRHGQGRHCHRRGGCVADSGEVYWRGREGGGPDAL